MSKFRCDQYQNCEHRRECGGAKPHEKEESECNKCPMNADARCVPFEGCSICDGSGQIPAPDGWGICRECWTTRKD